MEDVMASPTKEKETVFVVACLTFIWLECLRRLLLLLQSLLLLILAFLMGVAAETADAATAAQATPHRYVSPKGVVAPFCFPTAWAAEEALQAAMEEAAAAEKPLRSVGCV